MRRPARSYHDAIAKLLNDDQVRAMASSGLRIKGQIAAKYAEVTKQRKLAVEAAA